MTGITDFLDRVGLDRVPVLTNGVADDAIGMTPEAYFLMSRVDGRSNIKTIRALTGLPTESFAQAFVTLLAAGAVRVPGVARGAAMTALEGGDVSSLGTASTTAARSSIPEPSRSATAGDHEREPTPRPAPPVEAPSGIHALETPPAGSPVAGDARSRTDRPPPAPRTRERFESASRTAVKKKKAPKLSGDILPKGWPIPFDQFTFDPVTMSSGTALDNDAKQAVLYYHYHLRRVTYYALLGVPNSASRKDIKLAYFRLSKAFHPDRWYRKDTGEFEQRIEDVFKWLNRAYGVLSSPRKRKGYDKLLQRGFIGEWQLEKSTDPTERPTVRRPPVPSKPEDGGQAKRTVSLLLARARQAEGAGQWADACDLYERAVQVDATPDLRIKLAECMLKANLDPREIDRHIADARSLGADDKSASLLEAEVCRRIGALDRAESCFRRVLELEPENPVARLGLERLTNSPTGG